MTNHPTVDKISSDISRCAVPLH